MQRPSVREHSAAAARKAAGAADQVRAAQEAFKQASNAASQAHHTAQVSEDAHNKYVADLHKAKAAVKVQKQQLGAREKQAKAGKAKLASLGKEHDLALTKLGSSQARLKAAQQSRCAAVHSLPCTGCQLCTFASMFGSRQQRNKNVMLIPLCGVVCLQTHSSGGLCAPTQLHTMLIKLFELQVKSRCTTAASSGFMWVPGWVYRLAAAG